MSKGIQRDRNAFWDGQGKLMKRAYKAQSEPTMVKLRRIQELSAPTLPVRAIYRTIAASMRYAQKLGKFFGKSKQKKG